MGYHRHVILALAGTIAMFVCGCDDESQGKEIVVAQQNELTSLTSQISDPDSSPSARIQAASLLLSRSFPSSRQVLIEFLEDPSNPSARIATANAIATYNGPRDVFFAPLISLLSAVEPEVRAAGIRGLAVSGETAPTVRLIRLANDADAKSTARQAAISALQQTLSKTVITALVNLLDDDDPVVASAALGGLRRLTFEDFGDDPAKWRTWWTFNRTLAWSTWLGHWANNLNRRYKQVSGDNAALRSRLAEAIGELYTAGTASQRQQMLIDAVADPVAEVRVAALEIIDRRLASNEPISNELRGHIRHLLGDPNSRIRRASALGLASLRDVDSVDAMLTRLEIEQVGSVRQAIITALGLLGEARVTPAIVSAILAEENNVAAAAAIALATIADKHPLDDQTTGKAVDALLDRYSSVRVDNRDATALREAILRAMGIVGGDAFVQVLKESLDDPEATIRLAAVNGLARQGYDGSCQWIEPHLQDPDRGVRQAVITAIGQLGQVDRLGAILARTKPHIEPDAAVRQKAWDAVIKLSAQADEKVLWALTDELNRDPQDAARRVEILQMLVDKLADGDRLALAEADRQLGQTLVSAGRPAEAVPHFAQGYEVLVKAGSPEVLEVWSQLLGSMLAAEDPDVIATIAAQEDSRRFGVAVDLLQKHLQQLFDSGAHSACILLASDALKLMPEKLNFAQREAISMILAKAREAQLAENSQLVSSLVLQLTAGPDDADKAIAQLQVLADKAVSPLIDELSAAITADPVDQALEKAIMGVLVQVAPQFTGYDPALPVEERLKLLATWREQL